MLFQIKVRVNLAKMIEFGQKLQKGELDRSCIRGETHCLRNDPAVGFSIWEASNKVELEERLASWLEFYSDVDISEVITPQEAMGLLFSQLSKS